MFFTQFSQMMRPGVDYNLTISQTQTGELRTKGRDFVYSHGKENFKTDVFRG